ncbi:hypothetical protein IFR05_003926 [Cadophora sp. M221]|nr:hypothetical protein IFR05_003926 [Cadophora sp. M221]
MSIEQPTILFVPGAWHFPAGFDAVRELLKPLGYPTEAVALPSVGAERPTKTLNGESAHTRAAIQKLADAEKKIGLVTHSYGGVVGSCAVEDLGFAQRKAIEKVFYHDMSPSEQEKWITQLSHTSAAVFSGKSTNEPWHHMPCMYIYCGEDKAIPLIVQQGIAGSMGADISKFSISIEASHSPFLSVPDKLVEGIELAAKVGLSKSL